MKYKGMIALESLTDINAIKDFPVLGSQIIPPDGGDEAWHIYTVEAEPEMIFELSKHIKDNHWYAHFWNDERFIAVFKDKVVHDKTQAIRYGRSIGIPENQLDFKIT